MPVPGFGSTGVALTAYDGDIILTGLTVNGNITENGVGTYSLTNVTLSGTASNNP